MNMQKNKIAIIGHFGGTLSFTDGQTVKTKILYDELSKSTNWKIIKVDTFYKKTKPGKLLFQTISCLLTTRDIIVLLSGNGMNFYFPLLYFSTKLFGLRVYHDVIGGNLDKYIIKNPKYLKYLNSFEYNWVETQMLKRNIEKLGVNNCEVIPNFKRLRIVSPNDIYKDSIETFRFCTFSRVLKEKGIEDAINAVENINRVSGRIVCTLDIYGLIDSSYKSAFEEILMSTTQAISYKGIVSYERSVEVLKVYDALLFPTYWDGEGFPGTIVDAYSSGLPVIATDWNSNSELIENGKTGFIYNRNDNNALETTIKKYIFTEYDKRLEMKMHCLDRAKLFMPQMWIDKMIASIKNKGEKAR